MVKGGIREGLLQEVVWVSRSSIGVPRHHVGNRRAGREDRWEGKGLGVPYLRGTTYPMADRKEQIPATKLMMGAAVRSLKDREDWREAGE